MTWALSSIGITEQSTRDTVAHFGHNLKVELELHYTPRPGRPFEETPALEWKEKFVMIEHDKREHWEVERDQAMYAPDSRSLLVWLKRYIQGEAHLRGWVHVLNSDLRRDDTIGSGQTTAERRADAVRDYLTQHGGGLRIQIHDIPSLAIPAVGAASYKERLLLIDCGVRGSARRVKWSQYLSLPNALPLNHRTRWCSQSWPLRDLPRPAGYTAVFAPVRPPRTEFVYSSTGEYR